MNGIGGTTEEQFLREILNQLISINKATNVGMQRYEAGATEIDFDGTSTNYFVNHDLNVVPSSVQITFADTTDQQLLDRSIVLTDSQIQINFNAAPEAGSTILNWVVYV